MYMWSEEKFLAIVAILRHNWVQCATWEKFLKWLEIPWFLGCKQFLFQLESVSRPFSKTKIDFSTDLGMFFFAELRFAGENFKAETSSNFSKGWYTDLKGIFQQRPNVSISQKKQLQKKNGQVLQWDHFQFLWLLGLCFCWVAFWPFWWVCFFCLSFVCRGVYLELWGRSFALRVVLTNHSIFLKASRVPVAVTTRILFHVW